MLKSIIKNAFDLREGEFRVSFWMLAYIFLIIAVLLIIKPTVNALFLSELGVEQLPQAFLLVAVTAILSSYFYTKALQRFSLNTIIEVTLYSSIALLLALGILLRLELVSGYLLYFFYVWVSLYAVLSASQFWVLANLVYNLREAKRLFGFIGSGAIMGGIFGGYLTSILTPFIGNEGMIFIAAILIACCFPLLRSIWRLRVLKLNPFKRKKRLSAVDERPLQLIRGSRHLLFMALLVAVSVLVAKLVDYLFSDFAAAAIPDPEQLGAFFGFWFSSFNLVSLLIQLFLTRQIVGIWGVGFSLMLLPAGILAATILFLFLPELSAVVLIKAMDGVLKQSVHKSANELLSLPLPFELKNKTKSFIDVVVDSIATGLAGFLLIFVIQALELPSFSIALIILALVGLWLYFIVKVRKEYFHTFRKNLELITEKPTLANKPGREAVSVLDGMRQVFASGSENQILFMLAKLMEVNDRRFLEDVQQLLEHPSPAVKTAAIQNLYFLNPASMVAGITALLEEGDEQLTLATLEYLLRHSQRDSAVVYDNYLDHQNPGIAGNALYCLAREARDNPQLKERYELAKRIGKAIGERTAAKDNAGLPRLLRTIGMANLPEFYPFIKSHLGSGEHVVALAAIEAAGYSVHPDFIPDLLNFLPDKQFRQQANTALLNYGQRILPMLADAVIGRTVSLETARFLPSVIRKFDSQPAVRQLFSMLDDADLSIRLEVIRALSEIRRTQPHLYFNPYRVAREIYDECSLYHLTLSAMHTQIIVSYRNRNRQGAETSEAERDARRSLLELLERRLDAGLERIFKLLGLKYRQKDVEIAYEGLRSEKEEARNNAIDFLDNLLTGDMKRRLLPVIEEAALDTISEEGLQKIKHKIPAERECFRLILEGKDLKLKLAVLYLIAQQADPRYKDILKPFTHSEDPKIRTYARQAWETMADGPIS